MSKKIKTLSEKKVLSIFAILLLLSSFAFTESAKYQTENLNVNVNYNQKITPGDALFVRLMISTPKHKKNKIDTERRAALQLYQNDKKVDSASFYVINKNKKQNITDLLCGIPISPWWESGNFYVKIVFEASEDSVKEFDLPLIFIGRDFDKETIELDAKNTEIRTNKSPAVVAQIDKLNEILGTTINTDVYTTKPFISPTTSTRYTAHYGDRRIYQYSNGKTSTSLHYGNDYGIPEGSEVRSCADGKVVLAEMRNSTGYSIVIEHLPGLYSLYYHMSELKVKEGDIVKPNQLIGKSGSTGLATGPHLHWEVRLNSQAVRPEFFMNDFTFENN